LVQITYVEDARQQIKYKTAIPTILLLWLFVQIILHIAVQFHFLELLPEFSYTGLLFYGLFVGLSIFAYTSLMDRSWIAVPFELIKTVLGFSILNYYGGWFMLNEKFALSTILIGAYLLVSLGITLYYSRQRSVSMSESFEAISA